MTHVVAAFDVDGTLTTTDTFLPFLWRTAGPMGALVTATRLAPLAVGVALGGDGRDRLKASAVHQVFAGRSTGAVEAAGARHAARIERRWLRGDTVGRLRWHQRQGHRTVIVSASLRPYLAPLGHRLGVDDVVCTELEVGPGGDTFTGVLTGGNCRAGAKADRLMTLLGTMPDELWAYGDSAGDDAMLALAHHPVRVHKGTFIAAAPLLGVDR